MEIEWTPDFSFCFYLEFIIVVLKLSSHSSSFGVLIFVPQVEFFDLRSVAKQYNPMS